MILDGAKEHYILDIEHSDKAIEIIETLLPAIPYPKKKKKRDCRGCIKTSEASCLVQNINCKVGRF